MFPIYRATELAHHLGTSVAELKKVLQSPSPYYEELILLDPKKPGKERTVLSVKAPLRAWQNRFYRDVLLKSLKPSDYSHGGRHGCSIKTNADKHKNSQFVYKADISNFYPGIHDRRVYRLFNEHFGCPPAVADLCCRLCTYRHHLALGLSTSPIIADHLLQAVDARIGAACKRAGWVYTRYVDDITVSGQNDMRGAGIGTMVSRILREHGFRAKRSKNEVGCTNDVTITGVRIVKGRLDIARSYAQELDRQLRDALALTRDKPFDGPYYTYSQIAGRVRFACWVNPGRARTLIGKLSQLSKKKMTQHARERDYVREKKQVVRAPGRVCSVVD